MDMTEKGVLTTLDIDTEPSKKPRCAVTVLLG